jgi:hypothetical protein
MTDRDALEAVRHPTRWFTPTADGLALLLDLIGDVRFVQIAEATHETDEFCLVRHGDNAPLERWSRESSDLREIYPTGV